MGVKWAGEGKEIEVRTQLGASRGVYKWVRAFAARRSRTRLWYRWSVGGGECGPLRLDCEGKTWRRVKRW